MAPPTCKRALAAAKAYRTPYPPSSSNPELEQVLAQVPLPEFKFCANPEACGLDKVREGLWAR